MFNMEHMMQQIHSAHTYDVVIAGAGPAGCACALALKSAGLRVALLDKQEFPRDKVCGDAIPGRAIKALEEILPAYQQAFKQFPKKYLTRKTRLHYKGRLMERTWILEAYTCMRTDFDHFLFSLVKETGSADVFTKVAVKAVDVHPGGVTVTDSTGKFSCTCSVIVGCDGNHSIVARLLTARKMDRKHHAASVRAYYSNVMLTEPDRTEVFLNKDFFPGYFWVFPLPGNMVNAGFGMLSSEVARKKINIRQTFHEFIAATPELSVKFQQAVPAGDIEGFGLPLSSRQIPVSGERFLLTGDAASLVDPVSGAGIGNAMLSGKLAAEQIIRSFRKNDFSSDCMKQYDTALYKLIGKELRINGKILQYCSRMPFLLDIAFLMSKANR